MPDVFLALQRMVEVHNATQLREVAVRHDDAALMAEATQRLLDVVPGLVESLNEFVTAYRATL